MIDDQERNEELQKICDRALPLLKPYIKRLSVFGSWARGDYDEQSDIDLLILLKPPELRPRLGLFKLLEIEETLKHSLGREVELVTEEDLSPYIREYIEQDKVILYEEG